MSERYSAGVATAYGAALRGGYTGTYNDFCNDVAKLGNITEELGSISAEATTLEAGSSATASYNEGVFAFGIPRGNTGAQGERGETGAKGDKGDTGETGATGATGNGIASIAKTGTSGLVDIYTITFTDGTTTTFDVTNGAEAIDPTLSIAGRAADAKVTGDEIFGLKEELSDLTGDIYGGTILINESIKTSASVLYTIMCNIAVGDVIKVSTKNASTAGSVTIRTKNGNTNVDTLINGVPEASEYTLETSATGTADRLVFYTSDKATDFDVFIMSKDKESVVKDIIYDYQLRYPMLPSIVKGSFTFSDLEEITLSFTNANKLLKVGTGELVTYNGTKVTDMIDCSAYSALSYTGKTYLILGCVAFYNRYGTCIATVPSAEGAVTYNNEIIPVPINAKYMRIADNSGALGGTCAVSLPSTITPINSAFKWYGKKWVCVGDSLTEHNARATKNYHDYVAEATGITVVNMGVSGSGYARSSEDNKAFYQRISSCPTDADVVTIFGSFNDLSADLNLGSVDDTGTTTIAGCINTTIDNLQSIIPLANIGIVSPTPWSTIPPSTSGNGYNYVEMLKAICEKRSIPFLDLWRCSNLRPWDSSFLQYAYSKDEGNGVHPDENGHKLIAPRFEGFLDTLLLT